MHMEVVSWSAIQPNTGAAGVVFSGDSLTTKNGRGGIAILALWATNQTAGFHQIAFPSGHDTTRGYRAGVSVGVNPSILPLGQRINLQAQELMTVTVAGSNTAGDVEQGSALVRYADFPGIDARMISASSADSRMEKMTTVEQSVVATAGPGYSGEVAINTTTDLLLANRDYAILGMSCRTTVHAMTIRGPDFGNVRMAVPGVLRPEFANQYFQLLSRVHGENLVPVFNSGNKSQTVIGVAADENAGTFLVTMYLALLKKG